jgi:hypothetical protein
MCTKMRSQDQITRGLDPLSTLEFSIYPFYFLLLTPIKMGTHPLPLYPLGVPFALPLVQNRMIGSPPEITRLNRGDRPIQRWRNLL